MMNTCDTCKWWKAKEDTDEPDTHPCDHPLATSYNNDPARIAVADGEPYNAGRIATGPKFGCIHWETKKD